jgi:hypothetical protein
VLRALGSPDITVPNKSRTDLDSHADQCAVGRTSLIVHDYDRPTNVTGYNPTGPIAKDLRTVSAALAYDDPVTGETVILLVHQAIHIPDLEHNLLSTMQVHLIDVLVSNTPRFLTGNVTDLTHTLAIPTSDVSKPYVIPLSLNGVASTFPTRKPTKEEYESLPHLSLTSDDLDYDPHDPSFAAQEDALTKYLLETVDRIGAPPPSRCLCSVSKMFSFGLDFAYDGPAISLQQTTTTLDD